MDEKMLIHQAVKGDTHAFSELYGTIYKDLYRFALYTLKNPQDAEDCVSDTVMDAWAQIRSLRKEESFRAWIFRILSNKCRQRLKAYLSKTEELDEQLPAPTSDQDKDMDVRIAFSQLEPEDRLILSMNLFCGYTSSEIGKILKMNDNTVRSRQKRALARMAEYLRGTGGER